MVAILGEYGFQGGNGTDLSGRLGVADFQTIGLNQIPDNKLLIVTGLDIGDEDLIRTKRLYELLLIGKDIGLMFIAEIIIDHAPDRGIAGTGYKSNDLNGVLTIENIIDSVSAAYLYGIDLIEIKIGCGTGNVRLRQISLVFLVRDQVPDRNLLKMHIRHVVAE